MSRAPGYATRLLEDAPERAGYLLNELTEREREVLALIAEGRSNHSIATKLFLSPKSIESHISQIF